MLLLHFSGDSDGVTDKINRWVADNTAQKITQLISPGILDAMTRLVLVNAVYFKGDWAKKFNVDNTEQADFHVSSTEKVRVQLMHLHKTKCHCGVNQELNSQAIVLPYVGDRLSMVVFLPDKSSSLQELESALTVDHIVHVYEKFHMHERDVELWLPRFRLEEKLHLTKILTELGLTDVFSSVADLSGMDGTKELFISEMLHQAIVDVNEEGTEATAATALMNVVLSCADFQFRADRPFLFFIRDKLTASILFLGRLVKPDNILR
jgi:serine protease inhibitor